MSCFPAELIVWIFYESVIVDVFAGKPHSQRVAGGATFYDSYNNYDFKKRKQLYVGKLRTLTTVVYTMHVDFEG